MQTGMRFSHQLVDFRHFRTETIISEIDANPLRSQNAYILGGGGGTQIVPEYGGGAHISGQFSPFFYQHPLSSLAQCAASQTYKVCVFHMHLISGAKDLQTLKDLSSAFATHHLSFVFCLNSAVEILSFQAAHLKGFQAAMNCKLSDEFHVGEVEVLVP